MKFVKIVLSRHRGVSVVKTMEENMRDKIIIIGMMLTVILGLVACKSDEEEVLILEEAQIEAEVVEEESPKTVFVYVCGAVVNEGVYELPEGSRGYEAIQMAGGFTETAAKTAVDQAAVLQDEMTLYVPNYSEVAATQSADEGKVNLNLASREELMTLPGVGESKADSIISYREEHNGFKSIEEIMEISGIKEGLYNKIKDDIKI